MDSACTSQSGDLIHSIIQIWTNEIEAFALTHTKQLFKQHFFLIRHWTACTLVHFLILENTWNPKQLHSNKNLGAHRHLTAHCWEGERENNNEKSLNKNYDGFGYFFPFGWQATQNKTKNCAVISNASRAVTIWKELLLEHQWFITHHRPVGHHRPPPPPFPSTCNSHILNQCGSNINDRCRICWDARGFSIFSLSLSVAFCTSCQAIGFYLPQKGI